MSTRLEELIGALLDEVISEEELAELVELAKDPRNADELREQLEAAELLSLSEDALRDQDIFVTALKSRLEDRFVTRLRTAIDEESASPRHGYRQWLVLSAVVAALVLTIGSTFLTDTGRMASEPVAEIAEFSGSLLWTGAGGKVFKDLSEGSGLSAGTIESLAADSFAKIRFRDGSQVTVSGQSTMTLSGGAQKELYLRSGSLTAQIEPQPDDQPMIIHTPTARIEVLGTQLNVDASNEDTRLVVNEGAVRVVRLVDSKVAVVPAGHQIVASVSRGETWTARKHQQPVECWDCQKFDKYETYGTWLPPQGMLPRRLKARPLLLHIKRKPKTFYVAAFKVTSSNSPPVIVKEGACIRVRGRTKLAHNLEFGVSTRKPNGGYAGKFETVLPAKKLVLSDEFDIELNVKDFRPICSVKSPFGLQVEHLYIFTRDVDAKLEVTHVELLPPK